MIYQVIMQDEYNNLFCLGFYSNLDDAIPDVNDWLSAYSITIDEITEYPSTFGMCFDREIEVDDGESVVYLRGFVYDEEVLRLCMPEDLEAKKNH